ncbi:MAG: hypothetical protein DCC58_11870 [Chloroflexi bacterium]|nr:MAG: hypothetical protein DCC58_11870 [Chloroflexota bacterium]
MQRTGESQSVLDLAESAPNMLEAAVAVTTGRLNLSSTLETRRRIVRGDSVAISYFRFELARQVAAALLWMDRQVRAVYEAPDELVAEEAAPEPPDLGAPLRIYIEVENHTPALDAAIDALSAALSLSLDAMTPYPPRRCIEALVINNHNRRLLQPGRYGYRPAPTLLAGREQPVAVSGAPVRLGAAW